VVASGPEDLAAPGALVKLLLGVEDVFRDQAQGLLPGNGGQYGVALTAAGKQAQPAPGDLQAADYLLQLAFGGPGGKDQQVLTFKAAKGLLPGEQVDAGKRWREFLGSLGRESLYHGVETAESQPLGQTSQGQVNDELHGFASSLKR